MKAKNKNITTLEEFKDKNYGKLGTKERDELEAGYEAFKIGAFDSRYSYKNGYDTRTTCRKGWDN